MTRNMDEYHYSFLKLDYSTLNADLKAENIREYNEFDSEILQNIPSNRQIENFQKNHIEGTTGLSGYKLLRKYKIDDNALALECHKLFVKVQSAHSSLEKADILWHNYFTILWNMAPDDFKKRSFSTEDLKLSHMKTISIYVVFPKEIILTATKAVNMVFNIEKLKYPAWRLPFLIVFNKIAKKASARKEIEVALIEFAEKNMEYVHNCLASDRYFPHPVYRSYFKISKETSTVLLRSSPDLYMTHQSHALNSEILKYPSSTDNSPSSNFRTFKIDHLKKRNRVEYTTQEKIDLFRGWNKFQNFSDPFSRIAQCDALCLGSGWSSGKPRSNSDLNNLMKRLIKAGKVQVDHRGRRFLIEDGIEIEDCFVDFIHVDPKNLESKKPKQNSNTSNFVFPSDIDNAESTVSNLCNRIKSKVSRCENIIKTNNGQRIVFDLTSFDKRQDEMILSKQKSSSDEINRFAHSELYTYNDNRKASLLFENELEDYMTISKVTEQLTFKNDTIVRSFKPNNDIKADVESTIFSDQEDLLSALYKNHDGSEWNAVDNNDEIKTETKKRKKAIEFCDENENIQLKKIISTLYPTDIEVVIRGLSHLTLNNINHHQSLTWSHILNHRIASRLRNNQSLWKKLLEILISAGFLQVKQKQVFRNFKLKSDLVI